MFRGTGWSIEGATSVVTVTGASGSGSATYKSLSVGYTIFSVSIDGLGSRVASVDIAEGISVLRPWGGVSTFFQNIFLFNTIM